MTLRSPIGRARGLGSAKSGAEHFMAQRIAAFGLIPLMLWFVISVVGLIGADYATFAAWLGNPFNAAMMLLVVLTATWHSVLGLQSVIEDYVHDESTKWMSLVGIRLLGGFLAAFMTVSVLKVAVGV